MSASQVIKGKEGERELIRHLRDLLGSELTRNLDQTRDGGSDILGLAGWIIECKRSKESYINRWWTQTVTQANANNGKPVLCYRLDRCQWRVILALRHLVPGFDKAPHNLWLETSLDVFAALVREQQPTLSQEPEPEPEQKVKKTRPSKAKCRPEILQSEPVPESIPEVIPEPVTESILEPVTESIPKMKQGAKEEQEADDMMWYESCKNVTKVREERFARIGRL